ncbi:MAG: hypothetical protein KC482_06610 [Dehalococcoidia bacterium]|nr:hypothetical protein [Dehalococcoidia bacterium]
MNSPVTPYVLAGRILSILGMSLSAALAILFFVGGFWWWGLGATAAFAPFFFLIWAVERYSTAHGLVGPPDPLYEDDEAPG